MNSLIHTLFIPKLFIVIVGKNSLIRLKKSMDGQIDTS